jgi:hypothetical protein
MFFGLNSEIFLKNVFFGHSFEISIEFRQKSFKNYDFCWKKNFKQNFGIFAKNCTLNSMSLSPPPSKIWKCSKLVPLAWGTLQNPAYKCVSSCKKGCDFKLIGIQNIINRYLRQN